MSGYTRLPAGRDPPQIDRRVVDPAAPDAPGSLAQAFRDVAGSSVLSCERTYEGEI